MIRFVYIGDQINEGDRQFGFWDTVTDRFLNFDDEYLFDNFTEFESVAFADSRYARCKNLIPSWYMDGYVANLQVNLSARGKYS